MAESLARQWSIRSQGDDLSGLQLLEKSPVADLGPDEVLVELRAASLNYRDLVIAKVSEFLCNTPKQPRLMMFFRAN
jgi:NADPH:quinone reductase-like Zn-dependent oxidoreductase